MQRKAILKVERGENSEEYTFHFNGRNKVTCECDGTKYEFENIEKCSEHLIRKYNHDTDRFYLAMPDDKEKRVFIFFPSINKVCEHISYLMRYYCKRKTKKFSNLSLK